jgi:hypothetical protein
LAIPVITDHFQAQWIWHGPSGLPEDVYVNTWYFRNDDTIQVEPTMGEKVSTVLQAFYLQTNGTATNALVNWIPNGITQASVKVYDLGTDPAVEPRYPVHEETIPITASASLNELPYEVAICLSYYGGRGPRKRGRIYFGPLTRSVIDDSGPHARVAADVTTALTESALNVLNTSQDVTWVQVSTTYGIASPVQGGWVDNAFDTQRRRGSAPSARVDWGQPAA